MVGWITPHSCYISNAASRPYFICLWLLCFYQQESSPQEVLISTLLSTRLKCRCKSDLYKRNKRKYICWEENWCRITFDFSFIFKPKAEQQWDTAGRQKKEDWAAAKWWSVSWVGGAHVHRHNCPTRISETSLSNRWPQPGLHVCQRSHQTRQRFRP